MLNKEKNEDIFFSNIRNKINKIYKNAIEEKNFPGAALGIIIGGERTFKKAFFYYGTVSYEKKYPVNDDVFFDIASLTKPLATTLAYLSLKKEIKISLDYTLKKFFKKIPKEKENINIYNILNHSTGLPAHKPYFKKLIKCNKSERKEKLIEYILNEPLINKPGKEQIYSDLGFVLLGVIIEKISGVTLEKYVEKKIYKPIGLEKNIFFNYKKKREKIYAPTEKCGWRKKLLEGEVHDDNAFSIGGVSGQAGLFANLSGTVDLVHFLMDILNGRREHPAINSKDLLECIVKKRGGGTYGLGFDTPLKRGSSCGKYFSEQSFGHLGFTGTSFWVDLKKNISIVLLTNRVNPSRENNKIKIFRPIIHDAIMEEL